MTGEIAEGSVPHNEGVAGKVRGDAARRCACVLVVPGSIFKMLSFIGCFFLSFYIEDYDGHATLKTSILERMALGTIIQCDKDHLADSYEIAVNVKRCAVAFICRDGIPQPSPATVTAPSGARPHYLPYLHCFCTFFFFFPLLLLQVVDWHV